MSVEATIPAGAPPAEEGTCPWGRRLVCDGALFAFALLVRLAYLAEMRGTPLFAILIQDSQVYDAWSRKIAAGDWFGTEVFYLAPLYPYFLALVHKVLGPGQGAVRVVQALVDSGSCVLLAAAGRRLFTPAAGWLAGFLLALYGPSVFYVGWINKPVLDVWHTCLLLLLLAEAQRRPRWWSLAGAGVAVGLLALTRENALVLGPLLPIWAFLAFRPLAIRRRVSLAAAALLGLAVVLVPVGLRNRWIGGEFLITTSQMGPNFYIGNSPLADGTYVSLRPGRGNAQYEQTDAREIAEEDLGRPLAPGEVSRYWFRRAWGYIRSQPWDWVRLTLRKWTMLWNAREYLDTESIEAYREWSVVLRLLSSALHFGIIVPFGLAGVWLTRDRWRELWVLYAIPLLLALSITAFLVLGRFRMPLVPVLLLLGAAGVTRLGAAGRRDRLGAAIVVALCALASNWNLPHPWDPRAINYQNTGIELLNAGLKDWARGVDGDALQTIRQAETLLRRTQTFVPPNSFPAAETHDLLGTALRAQGRLDEAIAEYRQALAVVPGLDGAQDRLRAALEERDRNANAAPPRR